MTRIVVIGIGGLLIAIGAFLFVTHEPGNPLLVSELKPDENTIPLEKADTELEMAPAISPTGTPTPSSSAPLPSATPTSIPGSKNLLNKIYSQNRCVDSGIETLTSSPMRPQDVTLVIPLGLMVGGHVTPVDHQYFYPVGWRSGNSEVPIFAPSDGFIVNVIRYPSMPNVEGFPAKDGYDIVIEHSCTFYTKLGLLTGISDGVAKQLGSIKPGEEKRVRIPVTAGQQVARVGGQSLDFFTFDANTPPKKWIVLEHYNDSELKRYITDGFLYFTEPIKSELLANNPRTVEPRGGRFDYDIDGKLVGTWFLKGTNGYTAGDPSRQGYWYGHLVFAYNELDPSSIEVSMGSWEGQTQGYQFAVRNNSPDPQQVAVRSGLVKYELTDDVFLTSGGEIWNREAYAGPVRRNAGNSIAGTILVEMVSDRLIKVEKFPGKTAAQVTGFTSAAELYER